ncbi:hypothetical protein [Modicisalibacter xianhensis]|uniref:Uncharacterized protein n=1 Tax=Modicisalibacter xianhensis TaxID=442341 RepID=A0A1I3F1T2_9GAMM|nr:hypothetical protein [Halomonas xianhensis]SFI05152.1 hypothetical protein SAMN04487959_115128 [Halomonas xianhensis]
MIDLWNPDTFSIELQRALEAKSQLVAEYHSEKRRLLDEQLNSSPYQSLKPNRFYSDYLWFQEHELTPILTETRIRVWHYARLLDHEVNTMQQELVPSSLEFLQKRLHEMVAMELLSQQEADQVFQESPFHSQEDIRSGRLWTVTLPLHHSAGGVSPLLESWGGESAYFWLSDRTLRAKLRKVGLPRILEIETELSDGLNAFSASSTVLEAWARKLRVSVVPKGCDLAITGCLGTAEIVRIHTEGESTFGEVGKTYPEGMSGSAT